VYLFFNSVVPIEEVEDMPLMDRSEMKEERATDICG
jgi:hypothetical protein